MHDNGSLTIGQATVREMLKEQLSAMQSFFSKGEDLTVNVIPPPPVTEKPRWLHERSRSDAAALDGKARLATRLERPTRPTSTCGSTVQALAFPGAEMGRHQRRSTLLQTLTRTRRR